MVPTLPPNGSPFFKKTNIPGNLMASTSPTLTGVPPMRIQNFLAASRSRTMVETWLIDTPTSFGASNCAQDAVRGHNTRHAIESNLFMNHTCVLIHHSTYNLVDLNLGVCVSVVRHR